MHASDLGEFGLIEAISRELRSPTPPGLLLGIGDDAAAWMPTPGTLSVATADALIEGVHFDLRTSGWRDLGWKALAENVSDIAAMGCLPRYALVALGLSGDPAVADLAELYAGMSECASAFGFAVIGGDTVRADRVMISITLIGESRLPSGDAQPPLLTRAAARAEDLIAVSGPLGGSAAGLRLLRVPPMRRAPLADVLQAAHLRPQPRVSVAQTMIEAAVRCAIDVSDGLVADVGHICERSGVDADIDATSVPLFAEARELFPDDALAMALGGGEDYELVCTGSPVVIARANELLAARGESPLMIIGRVVERAGSQPLVRVLEPDGQPLAIGGAGWDHFAARHQET